MIESSLSIMSRCVFMNTGCYTFGVPPPPPPSMRARSNFGNYWSSAPSSVDTVRLPKELCTHKKGKAFNFLSLIKRVKLEIL